VPAIGYDALESIFYKANTECLTPSSNFAAARWCTAEVFGGSNKDNVHLGWDAVGVPNDPPPPSPAPTPFTVDSSGTGTFTNQEATTGELHQYTMPIREGLTVTCSTVGSNGDADLYVRFGSEAFPNQYNTVNACASATATSNESCTTSGAPSGGTTVYAGIHAFESYTGLKVTCKENPPPPTWKPTWKPTKIPTMKPTGSSPTRKPSIKPTMNQLTSKPITKMPTTKPTSKNQQQPTRNPTTKPTSKNQQPTRKPSKSPTLKPTTAVARVTLQTPICAECYLYYGNMFDVKAKRYVSIKSLTMVIQTGAVAEVWTRAGTHVGFEEALAGWTKVAGESMISNHFLCREGFISAVCYDDCSLTVITDHPSSAAA
jgi:hypothetical protein